MRSETADTKKCAELPSRLLLWALLASMICGVIGFGEIVEDALRTQRNAIHPLPASGEIVIVGIDDKSLAKVGKWPWNRSVQAGLIDKANAAGAERIFLELLHDGPGTPAEDAEFEQALKRSGKVVLADRSRLGNRDSTPGEFTRPLDRFKRVAETATFSLFSNYQGATLQAPLGDVIDGKIEPSFARALSGRPDLPEQGAYRVDYRIDPQTIPYVSASDVIQGRNGDILRAKKVVIGLNADNLGDQAWIPGTGRMASAYVHVIAAETLRRGLPTDVGWLPPLFLAAVIGLAALRTRSGRSLTLLLGGGAVALLITPWFLEKAAIFVDVAPALLCIMILAVRLAFLRVVRRGLVNEDTGLPNLAALRAADHTDEFALITARVQNHAELNAALSDEERREVAKQIVSRLNASGSTRLYHVEDGAFVWLGATDQAIGNHLEALHAMFRSPVALGARQIDVALSFGVELGSARSITNRLGSAMVAADEAWAEGLRWKLHDPSRQEEMNWRVSLLGELDVAIDNGEVWLAYQPQLDLRQRRIVGAEALARWTHPQKGPISPAEFVAAAETNGRIAKLTDFVLDRAIGSAAAINRRGERFQMAVNLSARLLGDRNLLGRIEHMLASHGLDPSCLTLELTETATLQDAENGMATLSGLRALGVRIAIDDYGTGLSTLDYLKKVPASELKIDQSFVKSMRVNRSDLIMVQSTISLAHSLGRTVVAEGVEDQQCLEDLALMECDLAQGFAIARPMGIRELLQRLRSDGARQVA